MENQFIDDAIAYADDVLAWDDPTFIREAYEHVPPAVGETPEEWIEWLVEKFDLAHRS